MTFVVVGNSLWLGHRRTQNRTWWENVGGVISMCVYVTMLRRFCFTLMLIHFVGMICFQCQQLPHQFGQAQVLHQFGQVPGSINSYTYTQNYIWLWNWPSCRTQKWIDGHRIENRWGWAAERYRPARRLEPVPSALGAEHSNHLVAGPQYSWNPKLTLFSQSQYLVSQALYPNLKT